MRIEIRRPLRFLAAALLVIVALAVCAAAAIAASPPATKGRIPDAAFRPGQPLDMTLVPDFVAASDQNGNIVGYVPKTALEPPAFISGRAQPPSTPVFAEDLKTLVGYMVPGKGFVPLGTDPNQVPDIPAQVAPAANTP